MTSIKHLFALLLLVFSTSVLAEESAQSLNLLSDFDFGYQDDILDVDDAFQLTTEDNPNSFTARWIIAEGHYLYRDKMQIMVNDEVLQTGALQMPAGDEKDDPIFQKTLFVYHNNTEVILPFNVTKDGGKNATFKVMYQGCSEISGICYPPQTREFVVKLSPIALANAALPTTNTATTTAD